VRQYVPSEVVGYIDQALSFVPKDDLGHGQSFHVSRGIRTALLGLVEITDRVPEHLIIDSAALTDIICGVQAIRTVVREAETQDFRSQLSGLAATLEPIAPNQWNPVILIRRAFARCPDDAPGPHVERLPFISDDLLRRSLETDLDAIDRAHAGREWKATVLGGSVVEAMLLWRIEQQQSAVVQATADALVRGKTLTKNPGPDPEKWHLADYIAVAKELKLIRPETANQCRLLTDFRNLIHPGKVVRTGQSCNKGTAHAGQAAIAFVIEDLR
jgi:hypothetical protein